MSRQQKVILHIFSDERGEMDVSGGASRLSSTSSSGTDSESSSNSSSSSSSESSDSESG